MMNANRCCKILCGLALLFLSLSVHAEDCLGGPIPEMQERAYEMRKKGGNEFADAIFDNRGFGFDVERAEQAAAPYYAQAAALWEQIKGLIKDCVNRRQSPTSDEIDRRANVAFRLMGPTIANPLIAGIVGTSLEVLTQYQKYAFENLDRAMEMSNRLSDVAPAFSRYNNTFRNNGLAGSGSSEEESRYQEDIATETLTPLPETIDGDGKDRFSSVFEDESIVANAFNGADGYRAGSGDALDQLPASSLFDMTEFASVDDTNSWSDESTSSDSDAGNCAESDAAFDARLAAMPSANGQGICSGSKATRLKINEVINRLVSCPQIDPTGGTALAETQRSAAELDRLIASVCTGG